VQSLIDTMYSQALMWSGAAFCPALPLLCALSSFVLIYVKQAQVINLCSPPSKPIGVAKLSRFFRSMILVTLLCSIVPFSLFLRRSVLCGPHAGSSPFKVLEVFTRSSLPSGFDFVLDIVRSSLLLWSLVFVISVYIWLLRRRVHTLGGELYDCQHKVQLENKERQALLKAHGIELGKHKQKGNLLFKNWMQGLGGIANRYRQFFHTSHFNDMYSLCKLTDSELAVLFNEWVIKDPSGTSLDPMPAAHVQFFIKEVAKMRLQLISRKGA